MTHLVAVLDILVVHVAFNKMRSTCGGGTRRLRARSAFKNEQIISDRLESGIDGADNRLAGVVPESSAPGTAVATALAEIETRKAKVPRLQATPIAAAAVDDDRLPGKAS